MARRRGDDKGRNARRVQEVCERRADRQDRTGSEEPVVRTGQPACVSGSVVHGSANDGLVGMRSRRSECCRCERRRGAGLSWMLRCPHRRSGDARSACRHDLRARFPAASGDEPDVVGQSSSVTPCPANSSIRRWSRAASAPNSASWLASGTCTRGSSGALDVGGARRRRRCRPERGLEVPEPSPCPWAAMC